MTRHRPKLLFLTLAVVVVVAVSFLLVRVQEILLLYAYFVGINLTTFVSYGSDKRRAVKGRSRIPESMLHLLALAGGSPAAFGAQITFRHKTKKRTFRIIFVIIILIQLIAIAGACFLKHTHYGNS
ncbi:MAG: hypothetical protein B6I25_07350 [Planctomycetales bacterium 4572_13]|nr:MAG: hypothetical protein B6I25_07350 [Planctomycetales bacterium 4572_13]